MYVVITNRALLLTDITNTPWERDRLPYPELPLPSTLRRVWAWMDRA
jgi:hypothetical protein